MSLCALQSNKYNKIIYNEKEPLIYKAFNMAIRGEFKNENRWISREEFNNLKTVDPYVAICYSFGNNLKNYCYSIALEPWKKALHCARVFKDYSEFEKFGIKSDGSKTDIIKHFKTYKQKYTKYINDTFSCDINHIAECEHIERCERLKAISLNTDDKHFGNLQSAESLSRLQSAESFNKSYELVQIPENSIIYCDPPYINTIGYLSEFNHAEFYDWCRKQKSLVFISEYYMPDDFYKIYTFKRKDIMSNNSKDVIECLYCNKPYIIKGIQNRLF